MARNIFKRNDQRKEARTAWDSFIDRFRQMKIPCVLWFNVLFAGNESPRLPYLSFAEAEKKWLFARAEKPAGSVRQPSITQKLPPSNITHDFLTNAAAVSVGFAMTAMTLHLKTASAWIVPKLPQKGIRYEKIFYLPSICNPFSVPAVRMWKRASFRFL